MAEEDRIFRLSLTCQDTDGNVIERGDHSRDDGPDASVAHVLSGRPLVRKRPGRTSLTSRDKTPMPSSSPRGIQGAQTTRANANPLSTMIDRFKHMHLHSVTGRDEISRALWAACILIERLQARVTEREAQEMHNDQQTVDIAGNLR